MEQQSFFPSIMHGGDYNPEQWPESVWDDDVRLMQEANVNIATLPVFGWVSLQPDEDVFTFEWLDRIVDKLHRGGIRVCMATATASVPAWVDQRYPDILRVEHSGKRLQHGNRHTFCPNSPNYRRLSTDLARRLAERFGNHPALIAWHIGNEYSNTCYCDLCAEAFREWLRERYGSLGDLNTRWYTSFWGHTYTKWDQIEPPSALGESAIQALKIDYDRFQSHSLQMCIRSEIDAIREFNTKLPVTTNLMGTCKPTDYHKWAQELDIVSWDCYPSRGASPSSIAFQHSLMRGLKEGKPWMLMEQTPSQQNWQAYNALKRPGVMRLWSYQAMAHGADTVMYFQWRRGRGGCEKFHGAVVEHAGRTDVRVFQEVRTLGEELKTLGDQTLGGLVRSNVAVLFDWENWWGVEYSVGPSVDLKYVPQVSQYYSALHTNGVVADVVSPAADLSKYRVVVAPVLYMVKPGVAENLTKFVESGGILVVTYFSGVVDETDLVFEGGYPGPLRKLLGVWVEELDVLSPQECNTVKFDSDLLSEQSLACGMLCERIHAEGAAVIASYTQDFYAGEPAMTVNAFGEGKAYYVGTQLQPEGIKLLLDAICDHADVRPALGVCQPDGIEVVVRESPSGTKLTYILNHNAIPERLDLPQGNFMDLITCAEVKGELELAAYGVAILMEA